MASRNLHVTICQKDFMPRSRVIAKNSVVLGKSGLGNIFKRRYFRGSSFFKIKSIFLVKNSILASVVLQGSSDPFCLLCTQVNWWLKKTPDRAGSKVMDWWYSNYATICDSLYSDYINHSARIFISNRATKFFWHINVGNIFSVS